MRLTNLNGTIALAAAVALGGAGILLSGCVCSQVGCVDGIGLTIERADGGPVALATTLELDGRVLECPAPAVGSSRVVCDPDVTIWSSGLQACTDAGGDAGSPCGVARQHIDIRKLPARLRVVLRAGSSVVAERTFEPQYRRSAPNGERCGPVCQHGAESWTLP